MLQWSAVDGNLVPVVGADQSPSGDAPVPVSISLQQVDNNQSLAANTDQSARDDEFGGGDVPVREQHQRRSNGGGASDHAWQLGDRRERPGTGSGDCGSAEFELHAGGAMPQLTNFSAQVWNSVQPLLQAMTWINGTVPQNSEYMQMPGLQQVLGIRLQQASMQPSKTGDPYVDWVDSMLYNNGQPLTAGSSPLYGSFWNGQNQSAGQALSMVAPYLEGGVYLVAGMWMVGPTAVLGATCYAVGAFTWAGTDLAVNLIGGANSGMIASSVGQSFFFGAINEIPGIGNAFAAYNSYNAFKEGDVLGGILFAIDAIRKRGACFAGEMLIDVEGGRKRADEIVVGDRLWSRDAHDPEGELRLQAVEERFVLSAEIWHLRVGGQLLRTTGGHPFWVANRGRWLPASELAVGDLLQTRDGDVVAVESIEETHVEEIVYNWRVAEYHTYYVSAAHDAASLWAHNTAGHSQVQERRKRRSRRNQGTGAGEGTW